MARLSSTGPRVIGATALAVALLLPGVASAAVCGNGAVESGEDCDDGNTEPGDCCSPTCQYESTSTECRPTAGVCDEPDNCDGAGVCTPDAKLTTECRAAVTICDIAEVCDGVADDCPADAFEPTTTVCRSAVGICDAPDHCDGAAFCEPDAKLVIECRPGGGCDPAEHCDGVNSHCPPDYIFPPGTVCRPGYVCDAEEVCDGMSSFCPPDYFLPPGTVCRASVGVCDIADVCTGVSDDCPADAMAPTTTLCRTTAGVCDAPDYCDGVGACTPDAKLTTECRASTGACDIAESCDGVADDCPADASITECIDDDSCCPEGCTAEDDSDCLEVPALSLRGLALCFLILAAGGIVLLRRKGASRSAKAVASAAVIAFALGALVADSAYRPESPPGTGSCLATHQPGAKARSG